MGSRCQPMKKQREGGTLAACCGVWAVTWGETGRQQGKGKGAWPRRKGESWACGGENGVGFRLLGHEAEREEKGREERAFGPKTVEGEFFVFLLFFSKAISKSIFKIYLKYFDFAQNHTLNKTYALI